MPAKTPAAEPWTKGRPTLYKGIRMRSRLEADYAASLDRCGYAWSYEPECFAGDGLQWVPDFHETKLDANGHGRDAWVEIKPASLLERRAGIDPVTRIDEILTRMSVAWLSKPDAWLELAFWVYGEGLVFRVATERGMPWILYGPAFKGLHPLWPGMGQFYALDHRWDGVTASAR